MAASYKVLGQSAPSANTNTDLYTCSSANGAIGSTLAICNRGATTTARVAVRPAGAAIANQHYICYDVPVAAADTLFLTIGVALANTDIVTVYANTANTSFSLFGTELS